MLKNLVMCEVLCIAGMIAACDVPEPDLDAAEVAPLTTAGACGIAPGPVIGATNGSAFISPRSALAPSFTRSFFPRFVRQGGWSTTTSFVVDHDALTLPAVTAIGSSAGWMSLPVESDGSTMIGVSLIVCGDNTTLLEADTYASRWSAPQTSNLTDAIDATGSVVTGGTAGGQGGKWRTVDIPTYEVRFNSDSTFWLSIFAVQPSTPPSTPPPSMALYQVIVNYAL